MGYFIFGGVESYIDVSVINTFKAVSAAKFFAVGMIILLAIILVLKVLNVPVVKGKGIRSELKNIKELKNRDENIIRINKVMKRMTELVEGTSFRVSVNSREFMQYNINRAGLNVPGGYRLMTAEEFNAIVKLAMGAVLVIAVLVAVFKSISIGVLFGIISVAILGSLPMIMLRSIVASKDAEITANFLDYYLMIHYVLISGANTPLNKIMRSYYKITISGEMKRFVDNCVGHIETHGEYQATGYIAKDYREIAEVGKLMRLIKQLYEGGDIEQDLMGFRSELIKKRKYEMEGKMNRLIIKAKLSFNVLMILLVQAIISAMSIYLPDISIAKSIFGM